MTDAEINYQNMAQQVLTLLADQRPAWEAVYKKLLPDYQALQAALAALDTAAQQRSGTGTQGYTEAKDQAEVAMLDAAMPVVQGLKALYLDGSHPALGKVAGYSRSALDDMRGTTQVAALENLYDTAAPLAAALADEMVTPQQLQALHDRTAAFKPLLGTPRQQATTGTTLREAAVQHLAATRQAIARLDVRVPNLTSALPALVAAYAKARIIVDAGHGAKAPAAAA
jgi:N-acetylmuramoyl-L-alanine amidase